MNPTTAAIGDLVCRTFGELDASSGPAPQGLLILCHGFGAPGTDLVGLGPELAQLDDRLGSTIPMVFPEAPIDLRADPGGLGGLQGQVMGGRAWWHIDVGRFTQARSPEEILALASKDPDGLKPARRKLMKTLDVLMQQTGLPMSRIVLGGFSQGAMLATDVSLRSEEAPAALCVYSGALIAKDAWAARAPHRKGLKVLQTHGRQDPILPFLIGEALRDLLTEAGLDVSFSAFNGPHTISGDGIKDLAALTKDVLA